MPDTPAHLSLASAQARLDTLLQRPGRTLLGIVGAPGAGKSTLAQALLQRAGDAAQIVPMDGFHLANAELARLGRAARKGAPDTFDVHGYVALLMRLRAQGGAGRPMQPQPHASPVEPVIYAPQFLRELEEPIAGAIAIYPHTRLLLAEGNYLALDHGGWQHVAPLLDELWYLDVPPALRLERLIARHITHGRTPTAAQAWVTQTDEPNARLIEATRHRANFIVSW